MDTNILFILIISLIIKRDKTIMILLLSYILFYIFLNIYKCFIKKNIENFDEVDSLTKTNNQIITYLIDIDKNLKEKAELNKNNVWGGKEVSAANIGLLHGLSENVQNYFNTCFKLENIVSTEYISGGYYMQITPIKLMFYFVQMKDVSYQWFNFPIPFSKVIGAQVTQSDHITTENTSGSNTFYSSKIKTLNNGGIIIDSAHGSTDKSSCHVLVYGIY